MKPIKIAIYGLAIVVAVLIFCYTHSDRAKIVRLFESAAKIATREPGESVMEGAVKAKSLAAFFGKSCRFSIPEARLSGPMSNENISGAILAFRHDASRFSIEFVELDVEVDSPMAHVDGVVALKGVDRRLNISADESRPFSADLAKNDNGEWKIISLVLLKR